ncbi:organic cation transporter protein-like [Liolophura sinensis]|uniref:organic cation transporter protein-like n=1 Tax=Liolophura sinensis TaxID=3198878 RepID=UPI003158DCF4
MFDDILVIVGQFGTYQKRIYFLLCLPAITCAVHLVSSVFILASPRHRCFLPDWPNDTYAIQNVDHALLINDTIPSAEPGSGAVYKPCHMYVANVTQVFSDPDYHPANRTVTCDKWTYDKAIFESTIVTKMDLVCELKDLKSHAQMIYMAGVLIGSLLFGILSDIFGRKKIFFTGILLQLVTGLAAAWAPEYYTFIMLRMLNGASNSAVFTNAFVLGVELVGPSKRVWAGIVIEYFFALGIVLLAGIAFLIRNWRYLQIAVSLPSALFLVYWWIIPESPRWLIANKRLDEAEEILRHAAHVNKAKLPEKLFDEREKEVGGESTATYSAILHSPTLLTRSAILFVNWLVISMVYYGLSLNSGNLAGDIYLNFFLVGLVEFPAYTLCLLLLDRIGRKSLYCASMLSGGIACVCTIFPSLYANQDLQWVTVILAMVGKLGAAAAFAIVYVYSSELFPTVVRNSALGAASMFARAGGMISPYISDMSDFVGGDIGKALPLLIFGVSAVVAGLLSLVLPETLNKKLPETIEDGEKLRQDI